MNCYENIQKEEDRDSMKHQKESKAGTCPDTPLWDSSLPVETLVREALRAMAKKG